MYSDAEGAYPHMPGFFLDDWVHAVPPEQVESALTDFVNEVLSRADRTSDERTVHLRENWRAIQEADDGESAFCRAAGRLGLNPYDLDSEMADLLEGPLGEEGNSLAQDVLEAVFPDELEQSWAWVEQIGDRYDLRRKGMRVGSGLVAGETPAQTGYRLAREIRQRGSVADDEPIDDVSVLTRAYGLAPLRIINQDHVPSPSIRSTVGWTGDSEPVLAGPEPARSESARFLHARGLFHALFGCGSGPRLTTNAYSWDQKASRAFAAEVLAPRGYFVSAFGASAGADDIARSADRFGVSEWVVRRQLENVHIAVLPE